MTIDAVVFDMDDVLCRYDLPGRLAHLARLAGTTADAVFRSIWGSGFEYSADAGAMDAETYLAGFGERLGYAIAAEEWLEARARAMQPDPAMLALASALGRQTRIAILTNNGPLLETLIDRAFPALRPIFGPRIFFSSSFGTAKPDPKIFAAVCGRLGASPERTIFIDDKEENARGAEAAGLIGHHYRTIDLFKALLARHGLTTA